MLYFDRTRPASTVVTCRAGFLVYCAAILVGVASLSAVTHAQNAEPNTEAFFEQRIRPVLSQHCYSCHSADAEKNKKLQARLFLDTAEGTLAGGESGPALVKGKAAESLLVKALKHDGLEMPPTGKLPAEVIADFERWIDAGAIDPRQGGAAGLKPKREIDLAEGRKFWSFQPLRPVAPPELADDAWSKTPVDRFVAAKHRELGLRPAPTVSREKLLRRVYFDLIGLPPTPAELDEFLRDTSEQTLDKVIDRLLESPQYGERWGRHWLDVARFAESGGYEFDGFRGGAYHYRDWVIKAFNADLPYDEFVRMQLAGDLLRPGYEGASAVGFLVAGPYPGQITAKTVERIRYDQLDDMLMTIGGSMLGLTLGCVRCHEHKYDPIPQADYYALAANLAKTSHGSVTLDPDPAATAQKLAEFERELAARRDALRAFGGGEFVARWGAWKRDELPKLAHEPRWQVFDLRSVTSGDTHLSLAEGGLVVVDGPRRKDSDTYVVTARTYQTKLASLRLDALTEKSLPKRGPGLGGDGSFALGDFKVTARKVGAAPQEAETTLKLKPILAAFEEANQPLKFAVDENPGTAWRANADGGKDNAALFEIEGGWAGFPEGTELTISLKFAGPGLGRFRISFSTEPGVPTWAGEVVPQDVGELKTLAATHPKDLPETVREEAVRWFASLDSEARRLRKSVDDFARAKPRPQLTEVYSTVAGGQDVFLLRRGEVDNKQGKAEPGYVQVLTRSVAMGAGSSTAADANAGSPGAGASNVDPRLALGRWMTDVDQGAGPLLARVMVNRVWQHHFGEGLVGTPNDFGFQGERPTNPELLEWLAGEFVRGGWKFKPLHKLLLKSAAYQQSNEIHPDNAARDPDNRFYWHHKSRRLEAEAIRDALLAVGGNLEPTMYGPSVLDDSRRRSVYLRVKRSELIPFMTMFDLPEPTQSVGERISTTVPTQALALLNSPFVRAQAERLAARIRPADGGDVTTAIEQAYRIALSRSPTSAERERMAAFVAEQQKLAGGESPAQRDQALLEFCHALLCLNEFVYID